VSFGAVAYTPAAYLSAAAIKASSLMPSRDMKTVFIFFYAS
jgi:hypothetical protein